MGDQIATIFAKIVEVDYDSIEARSDVRPTSIREIKTERKEAAVTETLWDVLKSMKSLAGLLYKKWH